MIIFRSSDIGNVSMRKQKFNEMSKQWLTLSDRQFSVAMRTGGRVGFQSNEINSFETDTKSFTNVGENRLLKSKVKLPPMG